MAQYSYKYRTSFSDCDPAGIMFFSRAYEIAHKCYEAWVDENIGWTQWFENKKFVFPIINSECKYRNPIRPGQEIELKLSLTKLGGSSFQLTYELWSPDQLHCIVKTIHVCVDKSSFKSTQLPKEYKNSFLSKFLA